MRELATFSYSGQSTEVSYMDRPELKITISHPGPTTLGEILSLIHTLVVGIANTHGLSPDELDHLFNVFRAEREKIFKVFTLDEVLEKGE